MPDDETTPEREADGPPDRQTGDPPSANTAAEPGGTESAEAQVADVKVPDTELSDERVPEAQVEASAATEEAAWAEGGSPDVGTDEVPADDVPAGEVKVGRGVDRAAATAIFPKPVEMVGGYRLMDELGSGGMGTVHMAVQVALDRVVALKILPERLASNPEFAARFVREAKAAARIDHPNVVRAIDVGEAGGTYYFAMEMVAGRSLEAILQERKVMPEEEALDIAIQAAHGLESAWRNGLVHRDIKPDNLLVTYDGVVKIADLGLAKEIYGADDMGITRDGMTLGSPHYISPEQASAGEVDIRSDIYSLGITLYRMVTGHFPFVGKDVVSVILARLHTAPKPVRQLNANVSVELEGIIDTMIAVGRDRRYPDPAVLLHDLERLATGLSPEYAGGSTSVRKRAIEAAHRRTASRFFATRVAGRRGRKRAFVTAGLLLMLAAVTAAAVFVYRDRWRPVETDEEPRATERPAVPPEVVRRAEARRRLNAAAGKLRRSLLDAMEAERYAEVIGKLDEAGGRYEKTPLAPGFARLRGKAEARLRAPGAEVASSGQRGQRVAGRSAHGAQADRRPDRAEEETRYKDLVARALRQTANGEVSLREALLGRAQEIRDTEEVRGLIRKARRRRYLREARTAEAAGGLAEAVRLYRRALDIRISDFGELSRGASSAEPPEAEIAEHVAELERAQVARFELEARLAEARRLAGSGNPKESKAAYLAALEVARGLPVGQTGDEVVSIRAELDRVEVELRREEVERRYAEILARARSRAGEGDWRGTLDAAREAGEMRPDAKEPGELVARARRGIGPEKEITNSIGMVLVLVPSGGFLMGGMEGPRNERPQRLVDLDAYYVSKFPVTNAQFEAFDPARGDERTEHSSRDDTPVVEVTWRDAVYFCKWLAAGEGVEYRLPTEAEWEKAARGTDGRTFPWGEDVPGVDPQWRCNIAPGRSTDHWELDGFLYANPVAAFPNGASPYGVHDAVGNVREWCADWYSAKYYAEAGATNPRGPQTGAKRVVRGGSFMDGLKYASCTARAGRDPASPASSVGFRVVRALDALYLGE